MRNQGFNIRIKGSGFTVTEYFAKDKKTTSFPDYFSLSAHVSSVLRSSREELDLAISAANSEGNDVMEFGMGGSFMFSKMSEKPKFMVH